MFLVGRMLGTQQERGIFATLDNCMRMNEMVYHI